MKKGLKVLSAVLALSMGLVSASLVSALGLSREAQELLKLVHKVEKGNPFYEKWSTKPEYLAALKAAQEGYEGVVQDSNEWKRLKVLACDAMQEIESIDNQLKAVPHFIDLAEDGVKMEYLNETIVTDYKTVTDSDGKVIKYVPDHSKTSTLIVSRKLVKGGDFKKLKELVNRLVELGNKDELEVSVSGQIHLTKVNEAKELREKAKEAIELTKQIISEPYQEAALYLTNFTEKQANEGKATLEAYKAQLNAIVLFVEKIAKDNGFNFGDCALPQAETPDNSLEKVPGLETEEKESKKDAVPDTAAFFKPLIPCCYVRVVVCEDGVRKIKFVPGEKCKKSTKNPLFTFEQLRTVELHESCCDAK